MGIKFLCPNGHKLHVKSFLAGKRAICPQCGERVIVPAEDAVGASDVGNVSIEIATFAEQSSSGPVRGPVRGAASDNATPPPAAADSSAPVADPIAEVPSAVWYVRPATGGQFGPASGEIMRNWVRDGRVGASSLVWRAGWDDWRSAVEVFPELRSLLPAPSSVPAAAAGSGAIPSLPQGHAVQVAPMSPPPSAEPSASPLPQAIRKRRRRNEVSLMTSGVLLAIAVILVIVLLLVFRSQMLPTETPPSAAAPAQTPAVK